MIFEKGARETQQKEGFFQRVTQPHLKETKKKPQAILSTAKN
jgi:hypothetical protein